jgi:hypothetical protein
MAIPFDLDMHYTDGSSSTVHLTPSVWKEDQVNARVMVDVSGGKKVQSAELRSGIFVDANESDNKWTTQ